MAEFELRRDSSKRLVFEMPRGPADSYRTVVNAIAARFYLTSHGVLITNGHDVAFEDYLHGEQIVSLEWDNWSGFMVVAKTGGSDSLVEDIAAWLQQSRWVAS
jgi:hypothetical protein